MSGNRRCSRCHKIKTLKTNTGINHSITVTQAAYSHYSGCNLMEYVLSDGILLLKSGGNFNEQSKVVNVIR